MCAAGSSLSILRRTVPLLLLVVVASCGGHPPSEVHIPSGISQDILGVGKGARAVPVIATKGIELARGIQAATPAELNEVIRSSTCESIALMLSENRFPTLADEEGFLRSSLAVKAITQVPPQILIRAATTLRGTLASALTNNEGVIPTETTREAATAVGCHIAAKG